MTEHTKEMYYFDSSECEHPEPEDDMSDEWQDWQDMHPSYDAGFLCKEKPAGYHCVECSEEHGETAWPFCRVRPHARLSVSKKYEVVKMAAGHTEVEVFVGLYECLDGDCDEYDVDAPPAKCSHITQERACSCQISEWGEVVRPCTKEAP